MAARTHGGREHLGEPATHRDHVDDGVTGLDAEELHRLDRLAVRVASFVLRGALGRRERGAHARSLLVLRVSNLNQRAAESKRD